MCVKIRMKTLLLYIMLLLPFAGVAVASERDKAATGVADEVLYVYSRLDFSGMERLNYEVFAKAHRGYTQLKLSGKLNDNKPVITICDYSLSANKNRMWVIDMQNNRVLLNTYVAHGQGTGEEYARTFSNKEGSHQSSMGFYVTGDTYQGKHGLSLYLHGMDEGYNSAAYERAIVMHGAGYVSKDFIAGTGRLGRSWGCPAVSKELAANIIDMTKDGTCLFIYYPDERYLSSSKWLKDTYLQEQEILAGK